MSVLGQLRRQRGLFGRCTSCDETFRLSEADLFDATATLPPAAAAHLEELKQSIAEEWAALTERRKGARERPRIAAESVNIGKVVEKIVPSLPGFPLDSGDCRSLLEPIDYLVFQGLARRGSIESVLFVEAKSGQARLNDAQSDIRNAVERNKVSLVVTAHGGKQ